MAEGRSNSAISGPLFISGS
ncbi:hypothetical protein [Streptacidiphilus neutrinimicus]|nr:hypothetical protein [Streptacidiphilus neutrinimicus]